MNYPFVMTEERTLEAALDGVSIARFGDGELKICRGRDAKSQQHAPDLSLALCRILSEHNSACLPCIPRIAGGGPKWAFWHEFTQSQWTRLYRRDMDYGSSFITRPDSAPNINRPDYWASVRSIWEDRDVVIVRGSGKSLTADRLPGAASVKEIVGPVQHAWAEHKEIFAQLRGERSRRVILCLGATATVLAWRLSLEGVHALDLGHLGMFTKRIGEDGIVPPQTVNSKA